MQTDAMWREIKKTVDQVNEAWAKREEMVQMARESLGDFYRRKKRVFYDTDMINESQEESVRLCPDCPGYMTITSSAQRGYGTLNNAFCVSIPRGACSSCREDAKEEYEEHLEDRRIGYVYLQDKDRDKFKFCNNMTHTQKGY